MAHKILQQARDGSVVVKYVGSAAGARCTLGDLAAWVAALVGEHGPGAVFALDCADDAGYEVLRLATPAEVAEHAARRAALAGAEVRDGASSVSGAGG